MNIANWQFSLLELAGWIITAVALAGVVLNNRRRRACFIVWMFSNVGSSLLHAQAGMTALTVRDLSFLALAVHGWFAWGRKEGTNTETQRHREEKRLRKEEWEAFSRCAGGKEAAPTTPKPDITPPSQNRRFTTPEDGRIARIYVNLTGEEITPAEVGELRQSALDKVRAKLRADGHPWAALDDLEIYRRMVRILAEELE